MADASAGAGATAGAAGAIGAVACGALAVADGGRVPLVAAADCACVELGASTSALAKAANSVLSEDIGNFESIQKTTTTYGLRAGLLTQPAERAHPPEERHLIR